VTRLGLFFRTKLGMYAPCSFGCKRGVGFCALLRECGELALGVRPRQRSTRSLGFSKLAIRQCLSITRLGFTALARRLLGLALSLHTRVGLFDQVCLGGEALARGCIGELLGFETCLCGRERFDFRLSPYFGLCPGLCFGGLALFCRLYSLRVSFDPGFRCSLGGAIGFESSGGLLLELGLGSFASTRDFGSFLLYSRARAGGFRSACFCGCTCTRDRLCGGLGIHASSGLTLELRFGNVAFAFRFLSLLLRRCARFRRFGRARFSSGARFSYCFSGAVGFPARSRVLLRFGFSNETRVSRFHSLLVGDGSRVRCSLCVELSLLARLSFLDCACVCRDAALRTQLRLPFHLGALKGNAGCIPIGFSACGRLGCTRAFRGLSRARHCERATLSIGRGSHSRFFGHRKRLDRGRSGRRLDKIARFGRELICDAFFSGAFALLPVAFDFAPHELSAAYVM